jgi:predicted ATPase
MHASSPQDVHPLLPFDQAATARRFTQLIVGREREQAILRQQFAAALGGHGALALVGGEAGIGKTTLTNWLAATAEQHGALVLSGNCYDLTTTPPYGPWLEAFAGYQPPGDLPPLPVILGNPDALARAESQTQIFADVREFLTTTAHKRPLLVLLEDLHWSDQASLELLRIVARSVAALPALLLVTYRADELTRRHPLNQLLPVLVRESEAARFDLKRLAQPALRELLIELYRPSERDLDRLGAYLLQHT